MDRTGPSTSESVGKGRLAFLNFLLAVGVEPLLVCTLFFFGLDVRVFAPDRQANTTLLSVSGHLPTAVQNGLRGPDQQIDSECFTHIRFIHL